MMEIQKQKEEIEESKNKISAAMIAYNEARRIERCLGSLKDFDEIVIVIDSKTDDGTEKIAREYGCRTYIEDWKGFGPQKQSAIDKCENDWVLIVDGDEALPAETAEEISKELKNGNEGRNPAEAYAFPRKNFLHGKWMRHGDWWPDWQVRLVNRKKGRMSGAIHEGWKTAGATGKILSPIEHFCFDGYADMLQTMDKYSSIIARDMFDRGVRTTAAAPLLHAFGMFAKIYIQKRAFLDGFDGLVTAFLKAGGSFFKYAKLLEMQRHTAPGS